eukprot:XP_024303121.1 uncharacterized protein SMPD5 [Homo sapiens]
MLTCVGAGTGEPEAAHTVRSSPALRRPHSRQVVLHVPLAASRSRLRRAGLRGSRAPLPPPAPPPGSLRQHLTGFAHRLCHAAFTPVTPRSSRGCTDESACPLEANESPRRPVAEELGVPCNPRPTGPRRPTPRGPRPSRPRRCTPSTAWPARCCSRPTGPCTSCRVAEEGGGRRAALLLLLLVVGPPLALPGLPLWLVPQVWRRPFCYRSPPLCWAPPALWRPPAEPGRCFVFLTANLCLLPDGQARFGNLPHSQRPAEAIGAARPALYRATDCSQPWSRAPRGTLVASLPVGLDFVCLQEVFDLRRARRLVNRLAPNLGPLLYDVGTLGLQPGRHLKLLDSGLLLASRYPLLRATFRCFPHARGEDALASKGLPSAQARLGSLDGRRIVGFLHCTHLQALADQELRRRELTAQDAGPNLEPSPPHPPLPHAEDGPLRSKQLTPLLDWAEKFGAEKFEADREQSGEVVAFSVLLGDLNFDNCWKGPAGEEGEEGRSQEARPRPPRARLSLQTTG